MKCWLSFFILSLLIIASSAEVLKKEVWDVLPAGKDLFLATPYGVLRGAVKGDVFFEKDEIKFPGLTLSLKKCGNYIVAFNGPSGIFFLRCRNGLSLFKRIRAGAALDGVCIENSVFVAGGGEGVFKINLKDWSVKKVFTGGYVKTLALLDGKLVVGEAFLSSGLKVFDLQLKKMKDRKEPELVPADFCLYKGFLIVADERKGLLAYTWPELNPTEYSFKFPHSQGAVALLCGKSLLVSFLGEGVFAFSFSTKDGFYPEKLLLNKYAIKMKSWNNSVVMATERSGVYLIKGAEVKKLNAKVYR